ncbi:MAG: restriction endonuclease [Sphingomicrobium sp.]
MRSWLVRLGKFGEMESHALQQNELVTGWRLGDLTGAKSREDILKILLIADPSQKRGTLTNWAVQLNQFMHAMQVGDLVVVPLKSTGMLAVGEVQSDWRQTVEGSPARSVKWLRTDLPRQAMKQDLLFSLGATQTVCEVSRNDAAKRFLHAATKGDDPGPDLSSSTSIKLPQGERDLDAAEVSINLADSARDQIERYIAAHFAGHAFTQLIAAILRAQGYQARVTPPGADKGVDIVAGQGALGFDGPRLVVQVKSGDVVVDQPTLQGLIGCIEDTRAGHGLLVAWSGFTNSVRSRSNELYFRVRLWGRQEILDALFSVYDQLPEDIRAELPLRRIWSIVQEEDSAP